MTYETVDRLLELMREQKEREKRKIEELRNSD